MDINAKKLERLITHIEDDGAITPQEVAKVIKAKPENLAFLRGYVVAAAEHLKQTGAVEEFDKAAAAEVPGETEAPAPAEPVKPAPPIKDEIRSEPEAPAPKAAAKGIAETPPATDGSISYKYRDSNGIVTPLKVRTAKNGVIVLEDIPTDEFVGVVLKGERVDLNITKLKTLPAGDTFDINGTAYPVASLLVIATAAKA